MKSSFFISPIVPRRTAADAKTIRLTFVLRFRNQPVSMRRLQIGHAKRPARSQKSAERRCAIGGCAEAGSSEGLLLRQRSGPKSVFARQRMACYLRVHTGAPVV